MTALNQRKSYNGIVTSIKMDKTVVVTVTETIRHKRYEKVMKRNAKFYAHDELNECVVGDEVTIEETRPLSKLKRWRVTKVKERENQE
ncbi:MAG: 30S ribosomal protein S17 [Chlamydiia bacterium]|nr:30S ribosomal protein S17 [Chlamydiia bacterium]